MTSIVIDNVTHNVEPVAFADIAKGDTIIHLYDNTREFGPVDLWIGTAEKGNSAPRLEWYGPVRRHATQNEDGTFTVQAVRDNDDYGFLIVASWHETEENHSLYRVV